MRKFTKKALNAYNRTIKAYEKLIADPEKEKRKWVDYGAGADNGGIPQPNKVIKRCAKARLRDLMKLRRLAGES